jgi:hypothetical protein
MFEKTGDRQLSAWEAGILTRRYGLDKEMVMDFFRREPVQYNNSFFHGWLSAQLDPKGVLSCFN